MGINKVSCVNNMKRKAVFLDRDGVLNRAVVRNGKPYPPSSAEEVEILPDVVKALQILKEASFVLIVVSNQPDVARGLTSKESVEEINSYLAKNLPIDRFIMCFDDNEESEFRKPRPGMLLAGAKEFNIDLEASFMVGDRWRDIDAGIAAGCSTIFIDYNYSEKQPDFYNFKAQSLFEAAKIINRLL
jgi:D-glycero-D-manno-heptose 1,7-bisphosphate phosphatase